MTPALNKTIVNYSVMVNPLFRIAASVLLVAPLLTSCQNELSCAISGDNLRGRVAYGSDVEISKSTPVVIEAIYATSFPSPAVKGTLLTEKSNVHGLLTYEYSLCVDNDRDVVVRAFQDTNRNYTLDSGESSGLYDGTSNGNATPTVITITKIQGQFNQKKGVEVSIDTP